MIDAVPNPSTDAARPEPLADDAVDSRPSLVVLEPRARAAGKFLFQGGEKLYVRGVTYGTFRPDAEGQQYGDPRTVDRDFAQMRANGLNSVRVYTVPPRWLLDAAQCHGLRVMVGLPWEQHITFLDDEKTAASIEERVRAGVRSCAGHPAVLCFAIGNEIPASIVRWYGARRVERFLLRLYRAAKSEDPGALVTYVNYPSTEYLELPFLDVVCFNVYLEQPERFEAYLARLQNLAGDRPLLMTEIGLDSRRNGAEGQARALDWQIRSAFAGGAAGTFVFSFTDEWHRGGNDIEDWDFGLTDRERRPKPALHAVRQAYAEVPFPANLAWPRISVVVCSYNGERTIRDCFEGLKRLEYPDFEVIVVDDGSTDATASIAREYGYRVISTENRGLSSARNTGMRAASGEIVAYTDDDARPDPHWLHYLAHTFLTTDAAAVGGPNIAPEGDGWIADCVANAPGGPVHVLLSDRLAEHIPGCNMALRKDRLEALGGFDPRYRSAGDDVDICWRLQQRGWTIRFNPAAMVWHHRRGSLRMYWKQQQGYGKAEALLEEKWPMKYNTVGHVSWAGRLYGNGLTQNLLSFRGRVYQGVWGSALFQSVYQPATSLLGSLPLMPEWYLILAILGVFSALGRQWPPMLAALPVFLAAALAPVAQAVLSASKATFTSETQGRGRRLRLLAVTALLHVVQPLARLRGRLRQGLTPWRRPRALRRAFPRARTHTVWSERWQSAETWLSELMEPLRSAGVCVLVGGDYDRWDLEVRGGTLGFARVRMAIEEHGSGKQLLRFRVWPRPSARASQVAVTLGIMAAGAIWDQAPAAAVLLGGAALALMVRMMVECSTAVGFVLGALPGGWPRKEPSVVTARAASPASPDSLEAAPDRPHSNSGKIAKTSRSRRRTRALSSGV